MENVPLSWLVTLLSLVSLVSLVSLASQKKLPKRRQILVLVHQLVHQLVHHLSGEERKSVDKVKCISY